jgi:hypothetical protein
MGVEKAEIAYLTQLFPAKANK